MMLKTRRRFWLPALLVLLLFVTVACDGDDEPAEPTPTEAVASETEDPTPTTAPTEAPTEVPTEEPTEEPEPTATVEPTAAPTEVPALAAYEPLFETADCQFAEPAGFDIECGYLTVPENRSDIENGRTVRLHVAIFHSDNPDKAADPVIYLEGGPGGDALETVPLIFASRFAPFAVDRDFIMIDQRGTGYSEPSLACPEMIDLRDDTIEMELTDEEALAFSLEALDECRARLAREGVDFSAYNSAENAADVNDLRLALGYDEWNLFGISYGTRLAQTIMRDYPEGLRGVILDSAYPLEVNLFTDTPANVDRALNTLFAGCAADEACVAAYPDLETVFWDTVALLETEAAPIQVFDLQNGETFDTFFDGDGLIGIVFQGLYSNEIIPVLPQLIYEASAGEFALVETLLSAFMLNSEYISLGMQFAVQCNEEAVFTEPGSPAAAAAAYPELENFFAGLTNLSEVTLDVCQDWGVDEAPAIENEAISSSVPTLVMAGEYDPITPPAWGEQVAANLDNSVFFLYPGVGHGASISGECPTEMAIAFLNDPTSAPDDSCVADMAAPAFTIAGETAAVTLVPYSNDDFGIAGVVPEGWTEQAPGVFARGQSGTDQTAIIFQALSADLGADFLLGLLEQQLQMPAAPELAQELTFGDLTWQLYESTGILGLSVDIAVTTTDDLVITVVMLSEAADRDALYEMVYLPMIEAAAPQ